MQPLAQVLDLSHHDKEPSFHALKDAGIDGVILKATEGANNQDPTFEDRYPRAISVFGRGHVHSYHMLTGADPEAQVDHYLKVTDGMPGKWLDYEDPCPSLAIAISACHILSGHINRFPGMYGSDRGQLGTALLGGHFTPCPLWIARYGGLRPVHKCDLWQFQAGEDPHASLIAGARYDASVYMGSPLGVKAWMESLCR